MRLEAEDKRALAGIARSALRAALLREGYDPVDPGLPALQVHCGCFVTLKLAGQLRGCLGCFQATQPLWRIIADYTAHSACEDSRFFHNPLQPGQVDQVEMDISVLTPLEPCFYPEAITLGVHGIYVHKSGRSGCFLPQVATETGWDVAEFWGHCCRDKAGLAWDAWQNSGIELKTFTAEVFIC